MAQSSVTGRLEVIMSQLGGLPPLPETYSRITQLTQDVFVSMDSVAAVIERDPAMTAAVLRIINSAYFGLPRQVSSVREAVRFLGIIPLKNIVLTIEIFEGLATGRRATAMQNEALLRAYAMRELMGRTPQVEQGFIAGILADVGHLLLISKLPADSEIIEKKIEAGVLPWVAEIDRLGCTSADIGGQLLTKWNLPPPLIEAVSQRHRPPPPEPTASVTTALMLVNAVEWAVRAPQHHRAEFEERALRLIGVFPGSTFESLGRYFGSSDDGA